MFYAHFTLHCSIHPFSSSLSVCLWSIQSLFWIKKQKRASPLQYHLKGPGKWSCCCKQCGDRCGYFHSNPFHQNSMAFSHLKLNPKWKCKREWSKPMECWHIALWLPCHGGELVHLSFLAFGVLRKLGFVGEGQDFLHGSGEVARHLDSRPLLLVAPGGSCPEVGLWWSGFVLFFHSGLQPCTASPKKNPF